MAQLRVIRGGDDGSALRTDELPVPVTNLTADPSVIAPTAPKFVRPSKNSRADGRFAITRETLAAPFTGISDQPVNLLPPPPDYGRYSVNARTNEQRGGGLSKPLARNVIAVASLRDDVGTSTITSHLAAFFSLHRHGAVAAIEAGERPGDLARGLTGRPVPEFKISDAALSNRDAMRAQSVPSPTGVEVLDAPISDEVPPVDVAAFIRAARKNFDTVFVDVKPDLSLASSQEVLLSADLLVVITGPNRQGEYYADTLIEWFKANGGNPHNVVVVVNGVPANRGKHSVARIRSYFSARVGSVVLLPLSTELASTSGPAVAYESLPALWRDSVEQLASVIVDRLSAATVLDLTDSAQFPHPGAELRVLPEMSDHDTQALLRGSTGVTSVAGVSSHQPTSAAFARPTNKGDK